MGGSSRSRWRSGVPSSAIHKQLCGISSDRAVGLGPDKVLSLPDAIGIAIEEWRRDRFSGVQQELMPATVDAGGPPESEVLTSMTHQAPAALRTQGNAAAAAAPEMELQFALHHSARPSLALP